MSLVPRGNRAEKSHCTGCHLCLRNLTELSECHQENHLTRDVSTASSDTMEPAFISILSIYVVVLFLSLSFQPSEGTQSHLPEQPLTLVGDAFSVTRGHPCWRLNQGTPCDKTHRAATASDQFQVPKLSASRRWKASIRPTIAHEKVRQ